MLYNLLRIRFIKVICDYGSLPAEIDEQSAVGRPTELLELLV
jgi:hypothetical protein